MKLNLKSKLLFLSVITMFFIVFLSSMVLSSAFEDKSNLESTKHRILEAQAVSKVVHFLQIERGTIAGLIASDNIDEQNDELLAAMHNSDKAINDAKFTYSYTKNKNNKIITLLNEIKTNRRSIYLLRMSVSNAKNYYTKNIMTLLTFAKRIPTMMNDRENRNIIQTYSYLSLAKESLGQIRATLNGVFSNKKFLDPTFLSFAGSLESYNANLASFQAIANKNILDFFRETFQGDVVEETFQIIRDAKTKRSYLDVQAPLWFKKSTQTINLLKKVEDRLFSQVNTLITEKLDFIVYKISFLLFFLVLSSIALAILMFLVIRNILSNAKTLKEEHNDSLLLLEQYKLAVDRSFIVSKTDAKGIITYVNDEFCKISGYKREELIGQPHNIIRHPDTQKETFKDLWHTIKNLKKPWSGEIQNLNKNGTSYWVKAVINPILDKEKNILEYIGVRTNITKIKNASSIDFLTGYNNRAKLNGDIKALEKLSIAIFNLDNFRQINDFYGHEFGNKVIKAVANKMQKLITDDPKLRFYRLQGDEFAILGIDYSKHLFEEYVKNILDKMKEGIFINEEQILTSCSCGISFEEKSKLLSSANMALKIAKKSSNNYLVYNESISLNEKYKNNIKWSKKLSLALKNDHIVTYFQPIITNDSQECNKYECLVRMLDGEKVISPFFFLDVAKQTRQYFEITKTVIRQAFETFKEKNAEFSINLSIMDMIEKEMSQYIIEMLQKYDIGHKVIFEIVESEYIENFEQAINFINEVKRYKCKIAIDDFGTGYSNFGYLIRLKPDFLKIDGSLIKDINKDDNAYLIVSTIVDFAKKLGMRTVAEFVENEEIFQIVKELGIDCSQGYHFSPPVKSIE